MRCSTSSSAGNKHASQRTRAQPGRWVEPIFQALDAVEDLRAAIEQDEEYLGDHSIIVEPLSNGLADVRIAIRNGEYRPGEADCFEFLDGVRDMDHRALPFWPLLRQIIDTHENGYRAD